MGPGRNPKTFIEEEVKKDSEGSNRHVIFSLMLVVDHYSLLSTFGNVSALPPQISVKVFAGVRNA